MGKNDQPVEQQKTPDPITKDATLDVAGDLLKERLSSRKGRKASFLTAGQRKSKTNSLLGQSSTLGVK